MKKYVISTLMYEWWCTNIFGFGLLLYAYSEGLLQILFSTSPLFVILICAVFGIGLVLSFIKTLKINNMVKHINDYVAIHKAKNDTKSDIREMLYIRCAQHLTWTKYIPYILVALGLLGTIVGLSLAFGSIPANLTANAELISTIATKIIAGASIAFYATIAGTVTSVWLSILHTINSQACIKFVRRVMDML